MCCVCISCCNGSHHFLVTNTTSLTLSLSAADGLRSSGGELCVAGQGPETGTPLSTQFILNLKTRFDVFKILVVASGIGSWTTGKNFVCDVLLTI